METRGRFEQAAQQAAQARRSFEQAAEAYQEVIRLGERQPMDYERLGQALLTSGKTVDAEAALKKAVELAPATFRMLKRAVWFLWSHETTGSRP